MREAEHDLAFAECGNGSKRLYPAPALEPGERDPSNYADSMARREGFDPPTLRFEASRSRKK